MPNATFATFNTFAGSTFGQSARARYEQLGWSEAEWKGAADLARWGPEDFFARGHARSAAGGRLRTIASAGGVSGTHLGRKFGFEISTTDTGEVFDRSSLNAELEKIEKPAGISNPKDFRNEIVNFVLRARANNAGNNPVWTSYEKLRTVIEKKMFSNTEELLPVISFNAKASADEAKKHEDFVTRMVAKGYTPKQVRLLCEWYLRVRKSS
jgi:hypothetical protein